MPEHDRVGIGEPGSHALHPAAGRAGVVRHSDLHRIGADDLHCRQGSSDVGVVDVAVNGDDVWSQSPELSEHLEADQIALGTEAVDVGTRAEAFEVASRDLALLNGANRCLGTSNTWEYFPGQKGDGPEKTTRTACVA